MQDSELKHKFRYKFMEVLGLDGEDMRMYGFDALVQDIHPKVMEFEKEVALFALQQMAADFTAPRERGQIGQSATTPLFAHNAEAFKIQVMGMERLLQEMVAGLPTAHQKDSLFEMRENPEDVAPLSNLRLIESAARMAWQSVKASALQETGQEQVVSWAVRK